MSTDREPTPESADALPSLPEGDAEAAPARPSAPSPSASPARRKPKTTLSKLLQRAAAAAAPATGVPQQVSSERSRVTVANRKDGGVVFWLGRLYLFAFLAALVAVLTWVKCQGAAVVRDAPPTPDLRSYANVAPAITRMYAHDGTLLGEFAKEWREIVPFEQMPKHLVDAVLAIEDHDFYAHNGLYYKGIARAAWTNATTGEFTQGGSTITQQVAKQFLTNEKSLSRKAIEAVMAIRLEERYSKRAILSLYMNEIFLGAGAYGVAAAAHRYFQKPLAELTLAECALIAGLAQAPTTYSPLRSPEAAIARRDVVLDQMQHHGFATAAEVATAKAEPLRLNPYRTVFPDRMPYYAQHVRALVEKRYGKDAFATGGLVIETAVAPSFDGPARDNVDHGTRVLDKRQGWRGPEFYVDGDARELVKQRQAQRYGTGPLVPGKRYLAIVDKVTSGGATVSIGPQQFELPLRNMSWAGTWRAGQAENDVSAGSASRVVKPGDLVWVAKELRSIGRYRQWHRPDGMNPTWLPRRDEATWDAANDDTVILEQPAHPQGAIFTADWHTGYVMASIGGTDFDRTVLDRTYQALRQPASTFKPMYYSLALSQGYGYETILNDVPITITDPVTGATWTPANLGNSLDGDVTLEYALVFSKNIPSVDLFSRLGADNVVAWARKLGFTTELFADDALGLGASSTYLDELVRAFSLFARGGTWLRNSVPERERDWVYVRRIRDRDGRTVEDNTAPADPWLTPHERLDRQAALAGVQPTQAIPARTAYLTKKLMAKMVQHGFTKTVRATEMHAAGKTGTSSDTYDVLFVAFTSRMITAVWLGDDTRVRALGRKDAAFISAVPMWARYMWEVARDFPNIEIESMVPDGVDPDDRGDHSQGKKGPRMDLYYRAPPKPGEFPPGADGAAPPGTPTVEG